MLIQAGAQIGHLPLEVGNLLLLLGNKRQQGREYDLLALANDKPNSTAQPLGRPAASAA